MVLNSYVYCEIRTQCIFIYSDINMNAKDVHVAANFIMLIYQTFMTLFWFRAGLFSLVRDEKMGQLFLELILRLSRGWCHVSEQDHQTLSCR